MIKHLFSDMDGTILNHEGKISDQTAAAIRQAGLPLTLVSARAPIEMREAIDHLDLDGVHVAFNAGLIFRVHAHHFETLHEAPLDYDLAKSIVLDLRQAFPQLSISVYDDSHWFVERLDAGVRHEQSLTRVDYSMVDYPSFFQAQYRKLFKLMLITFDSEEMERLKTYMATHYGQEAINVLSTSGPYLEVSHIDAKKSSGIRYIQEMEGLNQEELLAFGDGHNDVPMFQAVGTVVVMDNASEEIKRHADYVTKSNQEDGVAYFLANQLADLQNKED